MYVHVPSLPLSRLVGAMPQQEGQQTVDLIVARGLYLDTNSSRAEISGSLCFEVPNPETASLNRDPYGPTTEGIFDDSEGPWKIFQTLAAR